MNDALITHIARGDKAAEQFIYLLVSIANAWDDLIDRDAQVTDVDINLLMWKALIELPSNVFYMNNFPALRPMMAQAIVNWQTATDMERHDGDLEVAYIIRSSFVDVIGMVALLCGGREHALAVAPAIRLATHRETLAGYKHNLAAERTAREGE